MYETLVIDVPLEIVDKLENINFHILKSNVEINKFLADIFVSEKFCVDVFHKKLKKYDWEKIYYSLKNDLKRKHFRNSGIVMEYFSNNFLSKMYNLKNLINTGNISFEDPQKGIDIIFLDNDYKLQFYEVKSSLTENVENELFLAKKIKTAINSLFCSDLKNVDKISCARECIDNDKNSENAFHILKEIYCNDELLLYVNNEIVKFNICIIGGKIDFNNINFANALVKAFTTTIYCKSSCVHKENNICQKNVIPRIKILNIVNMQFEGILSLEKLYQNILNNIENMGVL